MNRFSCGSGAVLPQASSPPFQEPRRRAPGGAISRRATQPGCARAGTTVESLESAGQVRAGNVWGRAWNVPRTRPVGVRSCQECSACHAACSSLRRTCAESSDAWFRTDAGWYALPPACSRSPTPRVGYDPVCVAVDPRCVAFLTRKYALPPSGSRLPARRVACDARCARPITRGVKFVDQWYVSAALGRAIRARGHPSAPNRRPLVAIDPAVTVIGSSRTLLPHSSQVSRHVPDATRQLAGVT